jgi:hypothetical protein
VQKFLKADAWTFTPLAVYFNIGGPLLCIYHQDTHPREKTGKCGDNLTISWVYEANDIHVRTNHSFDMTTTLNREAQIR